MDLEPKKLMFCVLTAGQENERLAKDLLKLHDLLEGAGELKGNFELLKGEINSMLVDFEDFKGSDLGDDPESRTIMVKCFAAYMWILRIHAAIDRYTPLLSVMEGISEFSSAIDKTNKFQESNI